MENLSKATEMAMALIFGRMIGEAQEYHLMIRGMAGELIP